MPQYAFGIGSLTLVPLPFAAATPDVTPVQVGVIKDVNVDISFTTKELRGANIFAVDIARATGKITGKAKFGQINGQMVAGVLSGSTIALGQTFSVSELTGVIAGATYTNAGAANMVNDLGVLDENGVLMKRIFSAAPNAGEYRVVDATPGPATGVYTFNAGANGKVYTVAYSQKQVATGKTVDYNNQLMGSSTVFAICLFNSFRGKTYGIKLFSAIIPKLTFPFKNEDYLEQDLDFEAFADSLGNVLEVYTAE